MNKLRVGRIPFANVFPIYYTLEKEFDCSAYEFVDGVPSHLNRMLREGSIDLSPSSSIEYLLNSSLYGFVEGISISSTGPVGSIFLFSKRPVEDLGGSVIYVTSQSATSVALLNIILGKFYGLICPLAVLSNPVSADSEAFLLIGDDALKAGMQFKKRGPGPVDMGAYKFMYDLGEIWYKKTELPFVFALWIVRKELYNREDNRHELLERFIRDLRKAKELSLKNLREIAGRSPLKAFMSEEDIMEYWNKLDYDLSEEHKKGLYLFKEYLA